MFYFYRAMSWARLVGISCTVTSARMLHHKFLCNKHFRESDFTTAEKIHLNRVAVPCISDSASQSLSQPPVLLLGTPFLNPSPSVMILKDDLHVLPPAQTYSRH
jgi:hypothetical protein